VTAALAGTDEFAQARDVCRFATAVRARAAGSGGAAGAQLGEWCAQAALLRDLFGNPFGRPPVVAPAWLIWDGGVVYRLAQGIYAERAFDRLPVLGDALEEAGCTDEDILNHCRQAREHVRGCWLVDLLGKE
jgi:hypothetical protein